MYCGFDKIQYDRGLHLKMDTFFQTKTTRHKTKHRKTTLQKTTRQKYASQMSSLPHILPHIFFTAPYLPHILPIFDAPYSKNWKVESLSI